MRSRRDGCGARHHELGTGAVGAERRRDGQLAAAGELRARLGARHDGDRQSGHHPILRPGARVRVLGGLLDGRAAGHHRGAAVPGGLRRDPVGRAGGQPAEPDREHVLAAVRDEPDGRVPARVRDGADDAVRGGGVR